MIKKVGADKRKSEYNEYIKDSEGNIIEIVVKDKNGKTLRKIAHKDKDFK